MDIGREFMIVYLIQTQDNGVVEFLSRFTELPILAVTWWNTFKPEWFMHKQLQQSKVCP